MEKASAFDGANGKSDVTEALRKSEGRLRALVAAGGSVTFRISPDGTEMRELNGKGFLADTKRSTTTWLEDYIHPDDQKHVMEVIRDAVRTGRMFELEHRVRQADGTMGWMLSRAVPLLDAKGEITEWIGTATDVTQAKRAEAETQAIMDAAPVALYVARDPQCRHIIGNHMANELLRLPTGTNVSKSAPKACRPDNFRMMSNGTEVPPHELPIQKAAATGEATYNCELDVLYEDGVFRNLIGSAVPLFGDDGRPRGAVGAFLDITERKRMEETLRREARLKDEFLGRVGHELRNPLAALSFASEMLASATDEDRVSLAEAISREVALLQRLVDDLLDVARAAFGKIDLRKEGIDLAEFVQRMGGITQGFFAERRQEIVLRPPSETVLFMADGGRLEQIAYNLLHNASMYTGQGGRIEFSGGRDGPDVVIKCKDNGAGVPRKMQSKIFEQFARGNMLGDGHAQGGLGIGLTLVKQLAELHGGTVSVESGGPGTGSEFVVRLPFVQAPAARREKGEAALLRQRGRPLSIVVVEDDHYVGHLLQLALERAGHSVALFPDGPGALSSAPSLTPDAAIVDIGLPGMDGYELAASLKNEPGFQRTLFVAVSGRDSTGNAEDRQAFDHYLLKPVPLTELITLIEANVPRQRQVPP